jgi:putative membrane protein
MINYIIRLVLCGVLVFFIPKYLVGITVDSIQVGFIVAFVMSILNTFLKPILKLVSLPITFLTLGLFSLVITVGVVYLCAHLVDGFAVSGFLPPLLFSIILSIANSILTFFQKKEKDD